MLRFWSTSLLTPEELEERKEKAREYRRKRQLENPKTRKEEADRYKIKHPDRFKRAHTNSNLRRKYGISLAEKEAMIAKQNNRCPICGTTDPGKNGWHLDHCHLTKKVRDPLCYHCNLLLGHARDDVSILLRAIYYLDRHDKSIGGANGHKVQD